MHKVILYSLSFLMLMAACSPARKVTESERPGTESGENVSTFGDIQAAGLSGTGYFIRKASLEIKTGESVEKMNLMLRKNQGGEYLASVRSRSGIEGARILINDDTLIVNDRINRVVICAKPENLYRMYGFSFAMLALVSGDVIVGDSSRTKVNCRDGIVELGVVSGKSLISYVINCKDIKPEKTIIQEIDGKGGMSIEFGRFRKYGDKKFPEEIRLSDREGRYSVNVGIEDVEIPWEGEIVLIPGDKYERIELR